MDTGFYVSNATIVHRRPMIAAGWNARYGGASKLIPELFYTLVFLAAPGRQYKRSFRIAEIALHALTACAAYYALLAVDAGPFAAAIAALAFLALSSEPDYGSYFECAEHFEPIFHFISFAAITVGIWHHDPLILAIGMSALAVDVFFVKLSSAIGDSIVGLVILVVSPDMFLPALAASALVVGLYLVWIFVAGRRPIELLGPLVAHERALRGCFFEYRTLLSHKGMLLLRILTARPWLPALALYGLFSSGDLLVPLIIYLIAILATYFIQAGVVWYYSYLLLGPLSIAAGLGAADLIARDYGILILTAIAGGWLAQHFFDSYVRRERHGDESFSRRVWRLSDAEYGPINRRLEAAAVQFVPTLSGRSVFVVGPFNQLYVLLNSAYPTPIVSVASYWLDSMDPNWHSNLLADFEKNPPAFIIDSDASFDSAALTAAKGLIYAPVTEFGGFVLYKFGGRSAPTDPSADPFRRGHSQQMVIETLRSQLEASEKDRAERLEVIMRQQTAIETLRSQLEASEKDRAERLEVIMRQQTAIDRQQSKIDSLRRRLAASESQHLEQSSLAEPFGSEVRSLRAKVAELGSELQDRQEQIHSLKREIKALRKEL